MIKDCRDFDLDKVKNELAKKNQYKGPSMVA